MSLLNPQQQQQVAAAIQQAERHTDAELVTVLAPQADDYTYIPLLWAGLLALIIPGAINYFPGFLDMHSLVLCQWAVFIALALLFRTAPLRSRLVPRAVRFWRASNLARRQFLEQNLHHTDGETGMLIFVSEAERYVEILVDRGIAQRIPDSTWESIVVDFTQQVKRGDITAGFLGCIEACGAQLREHIPASREKNELPNHLVML